MKRLTAASLACGVLLWATTGAHAQVKVIPGEHRTVSATVEAIESSTRLLTVRTSKGELRTIRAPEQSRLSDIKLGDTVKVTYYDNIMIRVKAQGEAEIDTREAAVTPASGASQGATLGAQQTITATIDAIDLNVPSISFKGPRGWHYATKVQDKKALQQVKVGDRVDITWTDAILVSVTPPTK
jgi:hypothetical protein